MLDTPEIPLAAFDGLVFGPRSDMPIWQQIRDHILGLIEGGTLRPGSQLPGETHLAASLGVTRITLTGPAAVAERGAPDGAQGACRKLSGLTVC